MTECQMAGFKEQTKKWISSVEQIAKKYIVIKKKSRNQNLESGHITQKLPPPLLSPAIIFMQHS